MRNGVGPAHASLKVENAGLTRMARKDDRSASRVTGEEFRGMLETPDFGAFADFFGVAPAPETVSLFKDTALVLRRNLTLRTGSGFDGQVQQFIPIQARMLKLFEGFVGPGRLAIAEDDFGNYYFTEIPGDGAVYFLDNDLAETILLCESVGAFHKLLIDSTNSQHPGSL
jgi:hypothetical protein